MKREIVNGNHLLIHDSIDSLTMSRFESFNNFYMLDAGVGSDVESISTHIDKIRVFNERGSKDEVEQGLRNMRQNMIFVIQNINLDMYCFFALLEEINGRKVEASDLDDIEWMRKEIKKTGISIGKLRRIVIDVKKNLTSKLSSIFRLRQIAHLLKSFTGS